MAALVHILRKMQATRPDACVLRPVLREEARKAIGEAALLQDPPFQTDVPGQWLDRAVWT